MNGAEPKEGPILFSAPMVRAILAGTKTQTRRVAKLNAAGRVKQIGGARNWHLSDPDAVLACPYGQPGDRLWVRETFKPIASGELKNGYGEVRYGFAYQADGAARWNERQTIIRDLTCQPLTGPMQFHPVPWKPSIHMPRWASRITLEIVSVRVDRLNDISDDDAADEGIEYLSTPTGGDDYMTFWRDYSRTHEQADGHPFFDDGHERDSFRTLWESINGPGSWAANPWVWVVEFRRLP